MEGQTSIAPDHHAAPFDLCSPLFYEKSLDSILENVFALTFIFVHALPMASYLSSCSNTTLQNVH